MAMIKDQIKILIVDDFDMIRALIRESLKEIGYTNLTEGEDGLDGYEKILASQKEGNPFDLIFIDWNMPRMTGIEVIEKCKADESLRQLPFIMISTEREQKSVVTALRTGASDYIVKPFSSAQIYRKISRIFESSKKPA